MCVCGRWGDGPYTQSNRRELAPREYRLGFRSGRKCLEFFFFSLHCKFLFPPPSLFLYILPLKHHRFYAYIYSGSRSLPLTLIGGGLEFPHNEWRRNNFEIYVSFFWQPLKRNNQIIIKKINWDKRKKIWIPKPPLCTNPPRWKSRCEVEGATPFSFFRVEDRPTGCQLSIVYCLFKWTRSFLPTSTSFLFLNFLFLLNELWIWEFDILIGSKRKPIRRNKNRFLYEQALTKNKHGW